MGSGNCVDLGGNGSVSDGYEDIVTVRNNANVDGLTIENFGSTDKLVIGGATLNQADLKTLTHNGATPYKGITFDFNT